MQKNMYRKKFSIAVLIFSVIMIISALGIRIFSGEDDWICENGKWIKHGNPSSPMPVSGCGKDTANVKPHVNEENKDSGTTDVRIKITSPKPGSVVLSPVKIEGEAKGSWFFEGVFPVKIEDEKGNVLGEGNAGAKGEWMTENFVPFSTEIKFNPGDASKGFLIISKDNPSGDPSKEENVKIPILFK
jgi:hypothetical protein